MYHIPCDLCDASDTGETERSLKARFLKHRNPASTPSKCHDIHIDNPDHQVDMDGVNILAVEPRWFEQGVRVLIHISIERPTLNNDGGRYNLPSIWNNVLRSQAQGQALRTDDQSRSQLVSF